MRYTVVGPIVVVSLVSNFVLVFAVDNNNKNNEPCGLWLGPSPIKEREEHGFGLGIFSGRRIPEGQVVRTEVLLPVFDYDDSEHTPFREYLWSGEVLRDMVLESLDSMLLFLPGLASIAPCTTKNFNLEQVHSVTYEETVHRARDPAAGSFSYRTDAMFRAVREILPGEELTVECIDDDFDGRSLGLAHYDSSDPSLTCLDDKVEELASNIPGIGRGLFAKRTLTVGETIVSSPMVPVDRAELDMADGRIQLILNYCFGDPDSTLLWLPFGPFIQSINHHSSQPNAKVQWHQLSEQAAASLSRRQQYHHPELLTETAEYVAKFHGKGLVVDVVATRRIEPGEEVVLDYGPAWRNAWEIHKAQWRSTQWDPAFVSAFTYNQEHAQDELKTMTEQRRDPYPHNLQTACYFGQDWIQDESAQEELITYESWNHQTDRTCILPCVILERYTEKDSGKTLYSAKLADTHEENVSVDYVCHIFRRFEYFYQDIPREGITFLDKPHTGDSWLPNAFRHPIGVAEDMYPDVWKKRNFRRRTGGSVSESEDSTKFKRKTVTQKQETLDALRTKTLTQTEL